MRISKPVEIDNISQALSKGTCPVCAFLKNEQSVLLKGGINPASVSALCNFHAWALASAVNVENAAKIFLNLIRRSKDNGTGSNCSVCERLAEAEVAQSKNLLVDLGRGHILSWFRQQGVVCQVHGAHLRELAPLELQPVIEEVIQRSNRDIEENLQNLLRRASAGHHEGSGALGRAAELLTSQRGVNR